jgi:hypothetical protein
MTTVQISLLISGLAFIIALWARYEGFITIRRSRIIDRLKRIGECIELATKMNCKAEDFERLFEKVKPISFSANSDAIKLYNWEETMSNLKKAKEVTQAFIDNAYQDLEDFRKRKRVKLSQIEMEAFLAEFQGIKTRLEHLLTSFENLIIEKEILLKKTDELEAEHLMLLDKKYQQEAELEKLKKNAGI